MNEVTSINTMEMSRGTGGTKIAPQSLGEVVRFAEVMAKADIALPKHLRGNAGACMAVAMQALEWEMSPFAVASKSYSVNGTIAYEAQLIAAVVNTRSGIKGRLKYTYNGSGAEMTCTVTGVLDGDEYSYTSPRFCDINPKNSPLWKTDPQQQQGYYSARSWARRYVPEVMLGVYDRDEAEAIAASETARDITPVKPSLLERLDKAKLAQNTDKNEREGFSTVHVSNEAGAVYTNDSRLDVLKNASAALVSNEPLYEASVLSGADEFGVLPSDTTAEAASSHEDAVAVNQSELNAPLPSAGSLTLSDSDREKLLEAAIRIVMSVGPDPQILKITLKDISNNMESPSNLLVDKVNSVFDRAMEICKTEAGRDDGIGRDIGLKLIAGIVGCEVDDLL